MRVADRPGWRLLEIPPECDWQAAVAAQGHDVLDVLVVREGRHPFGSKMKNMRWLGLGDQYDFCQRHDWIFDTADECWRASDEPLRQPLRRSIKVADVSFRFTLPDAGWVMVTLSGGEAEATTHFSNVFSPFHDFLEWIDGIATGNTPRLIIDTEGSLDEWHVFDAHQDGVRLVTARVESADDGTHERSWGLDVTMPRMNLCRAAIRDFGAWWKSPELADAWQQWQSIDTWEERFWKPDDAKPEPYDGITWDLRVMQSLLNLLPPTHLRLDRSD